MNAQTLNATIEAGRRAGFALGDVLIARAWRANLEGFKATMGFRPLLCHVPNARWEAHYAANEESFSAAIEELPLD